MALHIFQCFICIHISLINKNWASGLGGRTLRLPPRFLPPAIYALENPLTSSVGRTWEQDEIVNLVITVKTSS